MPTVELMLPNFSSRKVGNGIHLPKFRFLQCTRQQLS